IFTVQTHSKRTYQSQCLS
ncbi:orn/Lys/Arg decarboxylase, N-terminal domain protein, partial [Vibrio parahaemolyticus V-223/04]